MRRRFGSSERIALFLGSEGRCANCGRELELGLHLRMALQQGWTEEELTEALLHLSGYVGVPIIRGSMIVASKAFAEYRAETATEKPASA